MHAATILLFDIDGTLVSTAGAGRRAMVGAFREVTGRDPCDFPFDGMTDRAIAREGLRRAGREPDSSAVDDLLERYVGHLEREAAGGVGFRVFAGIREAIHLAESLDRVALGLGTGNVKRGAVMKLAPVGLYSHFLFGGFGCDHEERAELIAIGARRGAERLGVALEACRVVVVGDTPRDVAAARAVGADCLAVATGRHSVDELIGSGATFAFPDLSAPGALRALLGER
ncbi:MAG: HAD hydrolase-like protein [Deltaproteobacteria bacterium]|nr:HAD hydrolase-like protein [Deltaproteobacteria bacterium]